MKFISTVIPLVALFSAASAVHVRYNSGYDNPEGVPFDVNCLAFLPGSHFKNVPSFPNIGASEVVKVNVESNDSMCGSCWEITYNGNSVKVVMIDGAFEGFQLPLIPMNALTNGHGKDVGVIDADAKQLEEVSCGL